MGNKRNTLLNLRMVVWALLIMLIVRPAIGAILWKGKFKVVSADPWKIEIVESYGPVGKVTPPKFLRSEKTGLPEVTEQHWICTGRLPAESDVGRIYEFIGTIPDIGGHYSFKDKEESLSFRSHWLQPSFVLVPMIVIVVVLVTAIVLAAYVYTKVAKK